METRGHAQVVEDLIRGRLAGGSPVRFTVVSGSMQPLLQPGDSITARAEQAGRVRVGDILVIESTGGRMVHRLVERRVNGGETFLTTKGDNTPIADDEWRPEATVAFAAAVSWSARSLNLESPRARWIGRTVAWLSRLEWRAYERTPGLIRSAVVAALDRAIYVCDRLIRWN